MVNHILVFLIQGLRPLLGTAQCKFYPTCGNFAVEQLKEKGLLEALFNISKRLISCNPCTR